MTLDVGGQYGQGGDVKGEEKEEEHIDEEEWPDEVVLELQERFRQGVLEQVLEINFCLSLSLLSNTL